MTVYIKYKNKRYKVGLKKDITENYINWYFREKVKKV